MKPVVEKVLAARRAGRVRRFHTTRTVCSENVAEHTFNMLNLAMILCCGNISHDLMKAILLHDQGEYVVGDIPSPVKKSAMSIDQAFLLEKMEAAAINFIHQQGMPELTEWEHKLLKLMDNLDGYIKAAEEIKLGNTELSPVYEVYRQYLQIQLKDLGAGYAYERAVELMEHYS